jgi:hypothetical protein
MSWRTQQRTQHDMDRHEDTRHHTRTASQHKDASTSKNKNKNKEGLPSLFFTTTTTTTTNLPAAGMSWTHERTQQRTQHDMDRHEDTRHHTRTRTHGITRDGQPRGCSLAWTNTKTRPHKPQARIRVKREREPDTILLNMIKEQCLGIRSV